MGENKKEKKNVGTDIEVFSPSFSILKAKLNRPTLWTFASSSSWRWKIQYCVIDRVDYRERSLQTQVEGFEAVNKEWGGWKGSMWFVWGTSVLLASNCFLLRYSPWSALSHSWVSVSSTLPQLFLRLLPFQHRDYLVSATAQWWDELGGEQALEAGQWFRSEWSISLSMLSTKANISFGTPVP